LQCSRKPLCVAAVQQVSLNPSISLHTDSCTRAAQACCNCRLASTSSLARAWHEVCMIMSAMWLQGRGSMPDVRGAGPAANQQQQQCPAHQQHCNLAKAAGTGAHAVAVLQSGHIIPAGNRYSTYVSLGSMLDALRAFPVCCNHQLSVSFQHTNAAPTSRSLSCLQPGITCSALLQHVHGVLHTDECVLCFPG
jgi:hypothetical protein